MLGLPAAGFHSINCCVALLSSFCFHGNNMRRNIICDNKSTRYYAFYQRVIPMPALRFIIYILRPTGKLYAAILPRNVSIQDLCGAFFPATSPCMICAQPVGRCGSTSFPVTSPYRICVELMGRCGSG